MSRWEAPARYVNVTHKRTDEIFRLLHEDPPAGEEAKEKLHTSLLRRGLTKEQASEQVEWELTLAGRRALAPAKSNGKLRAQIGSDGKPGLGPHDDHQNGNHDGVTYYPKLKKTDWAALLRDGVPEIEYLKPPYLVKGARTWIVGPTQSAKSITTLYWMATLSRSGVRVSYFSEENSLRE